MVDASLITPVIMILIAIVLLIVLYYVLKSAKKLIINAVAGYVIIILSSILGLTPMELVWPLNWLTTIVCALGGVIGAILLIILSLLNII